MIEQVIGINPEAQDILRRIHVGESPNRILSGNFSGALEAVEACFRRVVVSGGRYEEERVIETQHLEHSMTPNIVFTWVTQNSLMTKGVIVQVGLSSTKEQDPDTVLKVSGYAFTGLNPNVAGELVSEDLAEVSLPASVENVEGVLGSAYDHVDRWGIEDLLQARN